MNSPRDQVELLGPSHSLVCLVFLNPPPGDHFDLPCLSKSSLGRGARDHFDCRHSEYQNK